MNRDYAIPIILFISIAGLITGLFFRLMSKEVPKNIIIYTAFAVLLETIIYPLCLPIFFNRKKHARIKAEKIIDELKSNNMYHKNKISKTQLEKYIYCKLTLSAVCKIWMCALKDMIYNFDNNTNEIIDKIKKSELSKLISEREDLKVKIAVKNKQIKKCQSFNKCTYIYINTGFKVISSITNSYQDKLDSNKYTSNKNEIRKYLSNI